MYEQVKSACQKTWLLQCMYDAAMAGENHYSRSKARHLQVVEEAIYWASQLRGGDVEAGPWA
jgi:hypothetical protein